MLPTLRDRLPALGQTTLPSHDPGRFRLFVALTNFFVRVAERGPADIGVPKIGAVRPFPLELTAQLTGEREGKRYRISANAKGDLSKFEALVRGEEGGVTGEATVVIEPYATQAIRRVKGRLQGIDANAFASAAPRTLISVQADLAATRDDALEGSAQLVNTQAGSLDQEKLPITQVQGTLRIAAPHYEVRRAVAAWGLELVAHHPSKRRCKSKAWTCRRGTRT